MNTLYNKREIENGRVCILTSPFTNKIVTSGEKNNYAPMPPSIFKDRFMSHHQIFVKSEIMITRGSPIYIILSL